MQLTNRYKRVPCSDIKIEREKRQRRVIDTSDIDDSIAKRGVYNPILVTRDFVLIAGERRLTSSIKNGLADIPVRFFDELDPTEAQIVELEENVKRQDLCWQDEARAIAALHALYESQNPQDWSRQATAREVGLSPTRVTQILRVVEEMPKNERLGKADGLNAAYNIISRQDERLVGDAMSDLMDAASGILDATVTTPAATAAVNGGLVTTLPPLATPVKGRSILPAEESIQQLDFIEWSAQYTGPKFNLLHCDFPYGVNFNAGNMSGRKSWTTYNDDPDIYWTLIRALCGNLDKIMAHSGHIIFWFSMEFYCETLEAFRVLAPSLHMQAFPLIWTKTDNVGILPDPKRGPRRIYETALIGSREDRPIIKAVSNAYGAPTDKAHHPSTKPEPVLRQFFQMFVDENTRMLDPTCGSGSSLRAAESLGAKTVFGLERDPEHCKNAQSALRQFRTKRAGEAK